MSEKECRMENYCFGPMSLLHLAVNITKFPLESCKVYNECSECVTASDPLNCGWCANELGQGECKMRQECFKRWTKDSCAPLIYSVTPQTGPVQGGTQMTIQGRDFGSNQSQAVVEVKIADTTCNVTYKDSSRILCTTGVSAKGEIDREVYVRVVDRTKTIVKYLIEGQARSQHVFAYKQPSVSSLTPKYGPQSGGTDILIKGRNLNIGSRQAVTVANLPCVIHSTLSDSIKCTTTSWNMTVMNKYIRRYLVRRKRDIGSGRLEVFIDGAVLSDRNLRYTYKEDPTITSISPRLSTLSGGTTITVRGTYLNVVANPRMGLSLPQKTTTAPFACVAANDGLSMKCVTPNVTHLIAIAPTPARPTTADIWFLMDGVSKLRNFSQTHPKLSPLQIYPDPVYNAFTDSPNSFSIDDEQIRINGKYLHLVHNIGDVSVTVGSAPCTVTALESNYLLCKPGNKPAQVGPNEPLYPVKVTVGNLKFNIGSLRYMQVSSSIMVVGIGAGAGCAFVVIILASVLFYLKRAKKGPFKPKPTPEPLVRYTANPHRNGDNGHLRVHRQGSNDNGQLFWTTNHL
ncbi:hepatocyte growth factor receptor-like [Lingula anatina]|uniref:Hepatocyte growth factor receptor-like n=1 Tax=Lingula anatina TaxID=7574 RepID=A0A1S3I164_LINAN|nr:hepatocyte growth factor receptor-like [Lingula anatina]|eukprot:XP_013391084.1 hepatocyte growth factor receptor-like [Lingula anatina]